MLCYVCNQCSFFFFFGTSGQDWGAVGAVTAGKKFACFFFSRPPRGWMDGWLDGLGAWGEDGGKKGGGSVGVRRLGSVFAMCWRSYVAWLLVSNTLARGPHSFITPSRVTRINRSNTPEA